MTSTYEIIDLEQFGKVLKRTDENGQEWFIPMDEANSDYQRYLNPETEQSTPIVTDEAKTK
jgi:hypothetical protein